jgi:AmiR/NasT family two-component response regulator
VLSQVEEERKMLYQVEEERKENVEVEEKEINKAKGLIMKTN